MGKTSQKQKEKRLAGRVSLALAAGMFSVVPVAHGMPTVDQIKTAGTNVGTPSAVDANGYKHMNITGVDKNVIHWKDFSIAEKEHVHFDNNDYMNVVTGKATSAIDGIMDGGKNVYVINPNGVIFGANAQVNVGNLYVSTRKWANDEQLEAMETAFTGGSPVNTVLTTLTDAPTAEVVSLIDKNGYVAATEVVLEGNNIRFLNANSLAKQDVDTNGNTVVPNDLPASVTGDVTDGFEVSAHPDAANVIFRANTLGTDRTKDNYGDGYIHVGNGRTTNTTKNYSPTNANNYTARYLDDLARDGGESKGVVNYSLVRTTADLQAIGNNTNTLADNYMLADHIDGSLMMKSIGLASASGNPSSPKGVNYYTGHFDGMYYTVYGLKSNGLSGTGSSIQYGNDSQVYMGLFTQTNGATIENVGVVNATITTRYGGGVVGYAKSTTLRNVWTEGGTIGHTYQDYVGGIVGYAVGTDADHPTQMVNVYNTGTVKGGGLVGYLAAYSGIRNAYNIGTLTPLSDNKTSGVVSNIDGTTTGITLANVFSASKYAVGADATKEYLSANKGNNLGTGVTQSNVAVIHNAGELNTWITNAKKTSGTDAGNTTVSSEGGTNDTWRVYEGYSKSLPLLNSFMKAKGTVSTEYTYGDTQVDTFNYNSDNVPHKTYDAKTVMGDTPVYSYLGANVAQDTGLIKQNNRKNVYTDTSGNVAKFALFYNGQQGYDLYGNNFRINKKEVSFTDQPDLVFNKVYDGTADAKQALQDALFSADTGSGFLGADKEHLSLVVGAGINATYDDQNAGNNKDVTVSGVNSSTLTFNAKDPSSAEDLEIKNNYIFREDTLSNLNGTYTEAGTIEKRAILVGLYKTVGITKVYDGTADVYAGTKVDDIDVSGKDNVYANVDVSDFDTSSPEAVAIRDAMLQADFNNEAGVTTVTIESAQAKFIDDDGYDTSHVSDTTDQAKYHVAYTGITLENDTLNNNYKIVAEDGVAHSDNDTSVLLAKGNITPRTVSTSDLVVEKTDGSPVTFNRPYNHLDYDTIDGTEYQAGFGTNTTTADDARTAGNLNKIIDTDANKLIITPGNKATYVDASGNPTKNATNYNGEGSGAKKVQFNVTMGLQQNADARVLSDYQWDTGEAFTDGGEPILAGGMTGTITPLDVTANIKYVTKEYNGLATIEGAESEITEGMLYTTGDNADDVTISVSSAAFLGDANFGAADVAYVNTNSDEVADKQIQYTLAISGADAGNYRLTAAGAAATGGKTGTVSNRGRITPKDVTVILGTPSKIYDDSYAVGTTTPDIVSITLNGLVNENDFDKTVVIGRYGKFESGVFIPDASVSNDKDVAYTTGTQTTPGTIFDAFGTKKKNYTITIEGSTINKATWKSTNTLYGKGIIEAAHISSQDIANALSNINRTDIGLAMTYYGSDKYDESKGGNKTLNSNDATRGLQAADVITTKQTPTTGLESAVGKIFESAYGLTIAEAVYSNKNAGTFDGTTTDKDVSLYFKFHKDALPNYTITDAAADGIVTFHKDSYTGIINKKDLNVTLNQPELTKIYDGTTVLKASGTTIDNDTIKGWFGNLATNTDIVEGDQVDLSIATTEIGGVPRAAWYENANANANNTTKNVIFGAVNLTGTTSGDESGNYRLIVKVGENEYTANDSGVVNDIQGVGTITARKIRIVADDVSREYSEDLGTAVSNTTGNNTTHIDDNKYTDLIHLKVVDTGQDSESDKTVLGAALVGDDGYLKISAPTGSGSASEKAYGILTVGDVAHHITGAYQNQNNGDGIAHVKRDNNGNVTTQEVIYSGLQEALGSNYEVLPFTGTGTITPVTFTVKKNEITAKDVKKTYDGTKDVTASKISVTEDGGTTWTSPSSLLDVLNFTGTQGDDIKAHAAEIMEVVQNDTKYNDKNVAAANTITYKIRKAGNLGGDFAVGWDGFDEESSTAATITGNGKIEKKNITAVLDADPTIQKSTISKVYDRSVTVETADANTAKEWIKLMDVEEGDTVTINDVSIAYKDWNVASSDDEDKVTYSGIALAPAAANANGNYNLTTTSLTGYGTIKPKELTFVGVANDRYYIKDNSEATENDAVSAAAVTSWADQIIGDDDVKLGQLVGVYGSWDPDTNTWTTNPNGDVKRENGVTVAQDILYTQIGLDGAHKGNYTVKTWQKTLKKDNTTLTTTVYFDENVQKGTIKPISLTYGSNVNANEAHEVWKEAGKGKVYDGKTDVAGYDTLGNAVSPQDYMQIEYSLDDGTKGTLAYSVLSAAYESTNGEQNSDAGSAKKLVYEVELDTTSAQVLNNYDLGNLPDYFKEGNSFKSGANYKIARRLVNVLDDDANFSKTYDGKGNYALVTGENTVYKDKAGFTDPTNATGLASVDVANDAYMTYKANFGNVQKDGNGNIINFLNDASVAIENGNPAFKDVKYVFTLTGDKAKNYTLDADKRDVGVGGTTLTKYRKDSGTMISPKEVKVAFKDDVDKDNFDKTYDKSGSITDGSGKLLTDGLTNNRTLDDNTTTGILQLDGLVGNDVVKLDTSDGMRPTGTYYVNGAKNTNGDSNVAKNVDTQSVYIENLNLAGSDSQNYKLTTTKLTGKGDIRQRKVGEISTATNVKEEYDGTSTADKGNNHVTVVPASGVNEGYAGDDNLSSLGLEVLSAIYYDKDSYAGEATPENPTGYSDAKTGLGVVYRLKWNNKNYTLDRVFYMSNGSDGIYGSAYGTGEIKPRTLKYKDPLSVDKTYDGSDEVTGAALASGLFKNVVGNDDLQIEVTSGAYGSKNTGATAATGKFGTPQNLDIGFTVRNTNYRLSGNVDGQSVLSVENADDDGYSQDGRYIGTGRINRAQVTMTPTEVSYYPSQLATATYTGQAAGFVNGDNRPTVTYGRDGNTSTLVGKYTLLGYVNGKRVPVNGETFADGFENYYFTTTQNSALTILAEPVKPDVPVVPDIPTVLPDMGNKPVTKVVTESVISDTKFTPDEYSYNRMSKDSDTTHVNRVSSATLQYSEKGVNIEGEDTKSGLASLVDVQGRGSVVNLNGALIQTSAPAEQPEKVAETAALPISETDTTEDATLLPLPENEENDVSSIGLEYADNTGGSQSVLEILTNASSKAENKGTSIVIDTQDEDEEDAEIEKTRRAIFADRSNIGIETLGNAVNLNQMIG